jgi:hypothetical protein
VEVELWGSLSNSDGCRDAPSSIWYDVMPRYRSQALPGSAQSRNHVFSPISFLHLLHTLEVCRSAISVLGKRMQVSIVATLAEVGQPPTSLLGTCIHCGRNSIFVHSSRVFLSPSRHMKSVASLLIFRAISFKMSIAATPWVNVVPPADSNAAPPSFNFLCPQLVSEQQKSLD